LILLMLFAMMTVTAETSTPLAGSGFPTNWGDF
jgi:hypothetical protein